MGKPFPVFSSNLPKIMEREEMDSGLVAFHSVYLMGCTDSSLGGCIQLWQIAKARG